MSEIERLAFDLLDQRELQLADHLWEFNTVINVPAKHFAAYAPTRLLDERTFSIIETVYAIVWTLESQRCISATRMA